MLNSTNQQETALNSRSAARETQEKWHHMSMERPWNIDMRRNWSELLRIDLWRTWSEDLRHLQANWPNSVVDERPSKDVFRLTDLMVMMTRLARFVQQCDHLCQAARYFEKCSFTLNICWCWCELYRRPSLTISSIRDSYSSGEQISLSEIKNL